MLAAFANGDARTALGTLEMVVLNGHREGNKTTVTMETLEQCISRKSLLYDKTGEEHYNIISALHKSMRNSDPDAAVYWLSRMLEAGETRVCGAAAHSVARARTWACGQPLHWRSPWRRTGEPFYRYAGVLGEFDARRGVFVDGAEIKRAVCGV